MRAGRASMWTGNSSECQMSKLKCEGDAWEAGSCGSMLKECSWNNHGDAAVEDIGNGIHLRCNSAGRMVTNRSRLSDPKLACRAHI